MASNYREFAQAVVVVPSDTVNFTEGLCRGFFVGVTGNVVAAVNGTAITFKGCIAGTVYDIRCTRINATNTTATDIVALY